MKNRFGMFIHWGFYSLYGLHEQVLARYDLSHEAYEKRMYEFNPTEYDPEEWVLMAKNAGMTYICFTAKHHDGFCMWDTKYTDYNIMNTPYGKDVLKMLADACRKHGMKLSLYYSNPDWHHPDAYNFRSSHQWKSVNTVGNSERYRAYVKDQVRELLTNYGEIYSFYWDIPPRYEDPSINALVRELQPGILINDRGYDKGDFSTPEREEPDGLRFDRMTEACNSVGQQSWGYRANEDYYSVRYLMSAVDKIMAMGGSYILNAGPMPNGKIDEKTKAIFARIGDWYNRMEGVLEENEPYPMQTSFKEKVDCILTMKNGKAYYHFYNGLRSSAVTFGSAPGLPHGARLMNDGRKLPIRYEKLPTYIGAGGIASGSYISITDIPVDEFPLEPLVIEVEW